MDSIKLDRGLLRGFAIATILSLSGCALGTTEILLIFATVLLIFGASRLPQLGKALGETIRGFKQGLDQNQESSPKALKPGEPDSKKDGSN